MKGGVYGLLGEKLGHSFSKRIHNLLAPYEYALLEKKPHEVEGFIKNAQFDGVNVTIPYKKTIMSFCDSLSDEAQKIGSVNTIIKSSSGAVTGYNTDYYGFTYLIAESGINVNGKKIIVLGNGGASSSVTAVLRDKGVSDIVIVSRSGEDNYDNIEKHSDADIIINTTPVGMYPDNGRSPINLSVFKSCIAVFDIIYNPLKTELILQAEDMGIYAKNGLSMLTAQAKRAAELFLGGERIPADKIREVTAVIERETKNIALIGMPGAGKSSVGALVAGILKKPFYDSDEFIAESEGMSVCEIISQAGESKFRELEEKAVKTLSAYSGCVIALGGGVVTREENRRRLRQNCCIVYLDRPVSQLSLDDRPISKAKGVTALYKERSPLYTLWSDCIIAAADSAMETADILAKEMQK